jgi:hypothetical protein|tara:strand:+ start:836 stop:1303 length:468 start_codon:yes stop_codon:yes gene_type:complete
MDSTSLRILEKTPAKTNLISLICTLYTLSEENNVFKYVNLKNSIFFHKINSKRPLVNLGIFQEFYILINKPSLRKFAYLLLKPLLVSTDSRMIFNIEEENLNNNNEIILLKRYLRKFQYNYRRYFLYQNGDDENLPTCKEMNTYAIKTLFLLAGI